MHSVFVSSYTNTRESLGELEKAVETLSTFEIHNSKVWDAYDKNC